MTKPTTTKVTEPTTPSAPRTVRLSTVIWTVALVLSFVAGAYSAIKVQSTYNAAVRHDAAQLANTLKDREQ